MEGGERESRAWAPWEDCVGKKGCIVACKFAHEGTGTAVGQNAYNSARRSTGLGARE